MTLPTPRHPDPRVARVITFFEGLTRADLDDLATKVDFAAIAKLIAEWQPQALLVGLPLNMDDTESELSRLSRKFARRLEARYRLPVWMVDERLTSREARSMLSAVADRRKGKLPSVDSTAAVLLTEAWLESPAIGQKP